MRRTAMVLAVTLVVLSTAGGVAWAATIGCPNDNPEPGFCSGTEENDTMHGGAGADYMDGRLGEDVLYGHGGTDYLEGGDDTDRDRIYGGKGDDEILDNDPEDAYGRDEKHGGRGDDWVVGHEGPERLFGGRGDDTIETPPYVDGPADTIRCGPGKDTVFYKVGVDRVADDCEIRKPHDGIREPQR
jgi:Ca2+-binding RTX toxin-like protein